jgi:hypothetical protein
MKRCSNCILTEGTPNIHFDKQNVCNYCKIHQKIQYEGEKQLFEIFNKYRKDGNKYDCIVTLSGGRDSTSTLLKLVRDYQMKVLAVSHDNPFADPQAKINIKNAVDALNVDLISFKSKGNMHQRSFKYYLNAWLKNPDPRIITYFCMGCKSMWWDIIKIARKNGVRLIVNGMNRFEDTSFKKALLGISIGEKWETTYIKSFFVALNGIIRNPRYFKPSFLSTMLKGYFFGDPYAFGPRLFAYDINMIDLFFYIKWSEQEIVPELKSELNWDSPLSTSSTWRFDCKVTNLKDLIYSEYFGVTERDDFYAKLVRDGIISRKDAIIRVESENQFSIEIIRELLKIANIDYDEFMRALKKKPAYFSPKVSDSVTYS